MKSKRYGKNIRGKGRMGNSTYVTINKVRMRARYKQALMVLCKPGLHPSTHRKVYGVPLQRSIQRRREEKRKIKIKNFNTTSTEIDRCIKKPSGTKLLHFLCPTSLPSVKYFAILQLSLRKPKVISLRVS
jgi:hypothetical protein